MNSNLQEQQENIDSNNTEELLDFTNMFKSAKCTKPRLLSKKKLDPQQIQQQPEQVEQTDKKIIQNSVPRNLTITQEQIKQRKCLDLRRWYCLSRPQYQRSCGISSVVTVWNYLFSTLGTGTLDPISQEEAIITLNLTPEVGPHFNDVEFGCFSGNMSLITWFKNLCRLRKVQGRAFYLWKNEGDHSTPGVDRDLALQKMCQGLQGDKCGYIYHAYDHYFCPIGYECTPNKQDQAYLAEIDQNDCQYWIIIAEPAKPYPFFTVKKWVDIANDIELPFPQYMNIRKLDEGVKEYKNQKGVSQHCIMQFEKIEPKPKKQQQEKIDKQQQQQQQQIEEQTQEKQTNLENETQIEQTIETHALPEINVKPEQLSEPKENANQ